mmetsp:Transcript_16004/g.49604  ORF Transcript_16004/g.49604 Transcript_16004/m.49604 type:complete len:201 (+) Transcript_16004:66-668(+)
MASCPCSTRPKPRPCVFAVLPWTGLSPSPGAGRPRSPAGTPPRGTHTTPSSPSPLGQIRTSPPTSTSIAARSPRPTRRTRWTCAASIRSATSRRSTRRARSTPCWSATASPGRSPRAPTSAAVTTRTSPAARTSTATTATSRSRVPTQRSTTPRCRSPAAPSAATRASSCTISNSSMCRRLRSTRRGSSIRSAGTATRPP